MTMSQMEPKVFPPPQDNILDLSDLELCEKCKCALLAKFIKMYNETTIYKPWNQEDINRFNNEKVNIE